jgi:hypothetical protein
LKTSAASKLPSLSSLCHHIQALKKSEQEIIPLTRFNSNKP